MFDEGFKKLVELEVFIYFSYNNLYELEIDGKKNTDIYYKTIGSLKNLLKQELDIINNYIGNNMDMCKEWLKYVGTFMYEDSYIDLINNNLSELTGKRLYGIINSVFNRLRFSSYESFKDAGFSAVSIGEEKSFDDMYKSLYFNYKFNSFLELDFLNSVLYFINNEVYNNSLYRDRLIRAKYDFVFIHNELESSMIKSNFEVNSKLYSIIKMFADSNNISDDRVYSKVLSYYLKVFSNNIDYLVYHDSDFISDKYMFNIVLMDCFIRCSLMYLRDNDLLEAREIINDEYNGFISNKLLSIYDRRCINNITNIFNSIDEVKDSINVLSLK